MLPHGFHWIDGNTRLLLQARPLILIEPGTSPVTLTVLMPGRETATKYFVSHQAAIGYAERWSVKREVEIRLLVSHEQGAAATERRRSSVSARA